MVVEDEEILRLGTVLHLKSFGYEVIGQCKSGEEAIENSIDLKPDIILMDIKLGGKLDGIETVKLIQNKVDIPIIYISYFCDKETIERAKSTKFFRFLKKPFHEDELKFTIDMAIKVNEREKRLLECLKSYKKIFSEIPAFHYKINKDYKLDFYKDDINLISGNDFNELKNEAFCFLHSLILPDDREKVVKTINQHIGSEKPFKINYRVETKDSQIKMFQEIIIPVYNNENLEYIDGVIFDKTGKE